MSGPSAPTCVVLAPHNFEIGGSQIIALELAELMSRLPDYEVIVYGQRRYRHACVTA